MGQSKKFGAGKCSNIQVYVELTGVEFVHLTAASF